MSEKLKRYDTGEVLSIVLCLILTYVFMRALILLIGVFI